MSQPASDQNESSKMKKIMNGDMDESIKTRLPRANEPNGTTSDTEDHSHFFAS